MAAVTLEVEFATHLSADQVFKAFADLDNIIPKALPQYFKSIEVIEGDGGVGTVKLFTFGDALPYTSGKFKTESLDVSNYSYSYSAIEGDVLTDKVSSINHHVKVVPSANGGSVYKQSVVYNCKGNEKISGEVLKQEKEIYTSVFKAIEAAAA